MPPSDAETRMAQLEAVWEAVSRLRASLRRGQRGLHLGFEFDQHADNHNRLIRELDAAIAAVGEKPVNEDAIKTRLNRICWEAEHECEVASREGREPTLDARHIFQIAAGWIVQADVQRPAQEAADVTSTQ